MPGGFPSVIAALFWDVGGVLLTNAWDRSERTKAVEKFQLDPEDFHSRHEMVVSSFERGKITLDEYLNCTVFYIPRPFKRDTFREYMLSLSQALPDRLPFAQALAASGRYFMGTINNESRELNRFRIEKFALREIFPVFYSSCYVGLRKPEREIYRIALETTQFPPEQCCFLDDRAINLEGAAQLGMHTIQVQSLEQMKSELAKMGVSV